MHAAIVPTTLASPIPIPPLTIEGPVRLLAAHTNGKPVVGRGESAKEALCESSSSVTKAPCRPRVYGSWERSFWSRSPWRASLPAKDCKTSMKMTTCCRQWPANWSNETGLAKQTTRSGKLSTRRIKSCFQRLADPTAIFHLPIHLAP